MKLVKLFLLAALLIHGATAFAQTVRKVDICVYGGSSAGVIAAYTARQMGKKVLLIEPGDRLGGLTAGGLGYTDIGNKYAVTGLALDFYRRIGRHYGKFEAWIFEPKVALSVYQQYIDKAGVEVIYHKALFELQKKEGYIESITVNDPLNPLPDKALTIEAGMFLDCTYEGDLMAKAGVSYIVGREANSVYNETYNGVQLRDQHQFPDGIDPYVEPGNPQSGLLWGVSNETLAPRGSGDKKVQAYNYRLCLTNDPANRIPVTRPPGYDSTKYTLLLRVLDKKPAKDLWGFLKFDLMPNHKTDINNNGPFSTDMIGMNYDYPEAGYARRREIMLAHEQYTRGLLYFIGHDSRMPAHLRTAMQEWGYPKDEYLNNNHWTPQMYVREARRMQGAYVMTQANCEGRAVVPDGIGLAAYTMDSHNCERLVVDGMVKNEGDVQIHGFDPYPIAYRSIIPRAADCKNLLVPVCLSASHIAYGSIRMEPVFMVLGQSAAMAAVSALDAGVPVQEVNVPALQQALRDNPLADGSKPELIVDNDDTAQVVIQGNWKVEKHIGYGPTALTATAGTGGVVRFTPQITSAGAYKIYAYFVPRHQDIAPAVTFTVFDGRRKQEVTISMADLQVQGQTSGGWSELGQFKLRPGTTVSVNQSTAGTVIADALLFLPVRPQ